jgi:hypothetical protein
MEKHPSSSYHAPKLIDFIKKSAGVLDKIKRDYGDGYLGMIDTMDATFAYNPQRWNDDPSKFYQWYISSGQDKKDFKELTNMSHDMKEGVKKEASTVGAIKGFAGTGWPTKAKKGKGKKNPSKPYGESELFEQLVQEAALEGVPLEEVVKKRGQSWVYFDDQTGAQKSTHQDRDKAWEVQRRDRKAAQTKKSAKKAERERKRRAAKPTKAKEPETEKSVRHRQHAARKATKAATEKAKKAREKYKAQMNELLKKVFIETIIRKARGLKEGTAISYVFENPPATGQSAVWEDFVSRLSKDTVMSDAKLKKILQNMAKMEVKMLGQAVSTIKDVLKATKSLEVEQKGAAKDPETGDVALGFVVGMPENKQKLSFLVRLEGGKPLIVIPEESKMALNDMANEESKLLRAELMHIQETVLDNMEDLISIAQKRDDYLAKLSEKMGKLLDNSEPLEISMLKFLLKNKHKGVK